MAYTKQPMKKTLWQKFFENREKNLKTFFRKLVIFTLFNSMLLLFWFLLKGGIHPLFVSMLLVVGVIVFFSTLSDIRRRYT